MKKNKIKLVLKQKSQEHLTNNNNNNSELSFVNGYIFHCNDRTEKGCMDYSVFGSGKSHLRSMQNNIIPKKTCLLFYNISKRKYIHGIFVATSSCENNICNEVHWAKTFPAQVFMKQVYTTNAIRGRPPRGIQVLSAGEVSKMILSAGVNIEQLNKNIQDITMLEVFPFYKNVHPKKQIIIMLNFQSVDYNHGFPCKRILRFIVPREQASIKKIHRYVAACVSKQGHFFHHLKYQKLIPRPKNNNRTNHKSIAINNSSRKKFQFTPCIFLEQFTFEYLGWKAETSPILKVLKEKEDGSDQRDAEDALNKFNKWNANCQISLKIEDCKKLLRILNNGASSTKKMSVDLDGVSEKLFKHDLRFKEIFEKTLAWDGNNVKLETNGSKQFNMARRAILNYLKDLHMVEIFSPSQLIEYAKIIANGKLDNERDQGYKIDYNSTAKMSNIRIKQSTKKVNLDKLANLSKLTAAANNKGSSDKKIITRSKHGDVMRIIPNFSKLTATVNSSDKKLIDKRKHGDAMHSIRSHNGNSKDKIMQQEKTKRKARQGTGTNVEEKILKEEQFTKVHQKTLGGDSNEEPWILFPNGMHVDDARPGSPRELLLSTTSPIRYQAAPTNQKKGRKNKTINYEKVRHLIVKSKTVKEELIDTCPSTKNNAHARASVSLVPPPQQTKQQRVQHQLLALTKSAPNKKPTKKQETIAATTLLKETWKPNFGNLQSLFASNSKLQEQLFAAEDITHSSIHKGKALQKKAKKYPPPGFSDILLSTSAAPEKLQRVTSSDGFPALSSTMDNADGDSDEEILMNSPKLGARLSTRRRDSSTLHSNHARSNIQKNGMSELTLDGIALSQERKSKAKKLNSNRQRFNATDDAKPLTEVDKRLDKMKQSAECGFMFLCDQATVRECLPEESSVGNIILHGLFGSPSNKLEQMMEYITEETPLFLGNTHSKQIRGPFFANGSPRICINPKAFKSRFPAQIKVIYDKAIHGNEIMGDSYFNKTTNKSQPVLKLDDVNNLFKKLKVPLYINEKDRQRKTRSYEKPKTLLERNVEVLMRRADEEVKAITENPFLIIDAQNVVYHEEAPNKIGDAIRLAIRSLLESGYAKSNIIFIITDGLKSQFINDSDYNEVMNKYSNMFSTLARSEGTKGDDLFIINKALEIEKGKKGLPVIISNDSFRKEKMDKELIGDKIRRSWFSRWLDIRTFSYSWNRGKLNLSSKTPAPNKFRLHRSLSYIHVDPEIELKRLLCVDKVIEKIKSLILTKHDAWHTKKNSSMLDNICSKIISNWIFDCSREGTLMNDNGIQHQQENGWMTKGWNMQQTLKFGVDSLLPKRMEINKRHFLQRLHIGLKTNVKPEFAEELYHSIMHIMDNFRDQMQMYLEGNNELCNIKKTTYKHDKMNAVDVVKMSCGDNEPLHIFRTYYDDLKAAHHKSKIKHDGSLYIYATHDKIKTKINILDRRIYSMLQRYDTLWKRNSGSQGALPDGVFDILQDKLNVEGECFASPLNHRLDNFFSAFPDTDRCFGSLGSFFSPSNNHLTGSWECNPPFDVESVKSTLKKLLGLLENAEENNDVLSFVLFCPNFESTSHFHNAIVQCIKKLQVRFQRAKSIISEPHVYLYGFQHTPARFSLDKYWTCTQETSVFLFQSQKAFVELCEGKKVVAKNILNAVRSAFSRPLRA